MNMHNFPLGPAKPGDGPSPDGDCFSQSPSGTPIRPVGPTPTAGLEAGLQRAPQSPPRVAVRALSLANGEEQCQPKCDTVFSAAQNSASMQTMTRSTPAERPNVTARPVTQRDKNATKPTNASTGIWAGATGADITEGPAAIRDALFRCADAMADGFGRDWEREEIERRARAWEQRQRHG